MSNVKFNPRLARCVRRGDLTRGDLVLWFDRPYTTIRSWLVTEREPDPASPAGREAHRLLDILEAAIKRDVRFPVPAGLGQRTRKRYVKELVAKHVHKYGARISETRAAG
jgi:hypothetical protein